MNEFNNDMFKPIIGARLIKGGFWRIFLKNKKDEKL